MNDKIKKILSLSTPNLISININNIDGNNIFNGKGVLYEHIEEKYSESDPYGAYGYNIIVNSNKKYYLIINKKIETDIIGSAHIIKKDLSIFILSSRFFLLECFLEKKENKFIYQIFIT